MGQIMAKPVRERVKRHREAAALYQGLVRVDVELSRQLVTVRPENPKMLRFLTFSSHVLTLDVGAREHQALYLGMGQISAHAW
jgi:hypothetical protein